MSDDKIEITINVSDTVPLSLHQEVHWKVNALKSRLRDVQTENDELIRKIDELNKIIAELRR